MCQKKKKLKIFLLKKYKIKYNTIPLLLLFCNTVVRVI